MDNVILEYVGNRDGHGYHIEGVPACDLTQEQIDASGYTLDELLAFSGPVYVLARKVINGADGNTVKEVA
jgi:hypothetical protein